MNVYNYICIIRRFIDILEHNSDAQETHFQHNSPHRDDFVTHSSRLLADPFGIATNFPIFAIHIQCRLYYLFHYQTFLKVPWKVNISDKNKSTTCSGDQVFLLSIYKKCCLNQKQLSFIKRKCL